MRELSIDLETYSELDIRDVGAYAYAEHPSFEILLFGYAFGDDPVELVDLAQGEKIPDKIIIHLYNKTTNTIKNAFNANFERVAIANHLFKNQKDIKHIDWFDISYDDKYSFFSPPEQWRCTAVRSRTLGLPGSLKRAAEALNLEQKKDSRGKKLINYFCKPCKPTKKNGGRTRNLPEHAPEMWEEFKEYCKQDVVVEREVKKKLSVFPVDDDEWELWFVDQRINDRGVKIDRELVENAVKQDDAYTRDLMEEARQLAGIDNPNSLTQLKGYLSKKLGREVKKVTKKTMPALLEEAQSEEVERVLNIRKSMAKTSNSKYSKMLQTACPDDRIRGLLQFYGAGTGRWAGRLVQVQNLPRNKIKDLDVARELAKVADYKSINLLYGSFSNTLSQLIRTALIPADGKKFVVSDFSAIEARVIAWLAGEDWRMEVFNTHGRIYEASASNMFKIPLDTIVKGHDNYKYRAKGKIAELALGYQGGPGALKSFGALKMGISENELRPLVDAWRKANPNIVQFWYETESVAKKVVKYALSNNKSARYEWHHGMEMIYKAGIFFIKLPSGRKLAYPSMRLTEHPKFNKMSLQYKDARYGWNMTYGGKLVENIVQAVARDCLAVSLVRLEKEGFNQVMHVHDETVIETASPNLERVYEIMSAPIEWADGLPLGADGFVADYYMKD